MASFQHRFLPWVCCSTIALGSNAAIGQVVPDGATQVQTQPQTAIDPTGGTVYQIDGGARSSDGANLFHEFDRLSLSADDVARFLTDPSVENILTRTLNGPTTIDGLLQVVGSSADLYLIDPAGVIFGETARLDVAGDFFAVAASGVEFGGGWLDVGRGAIDYGQFVGDPVGFELSGVGAIVNRGELAVGSSAAIGLLGGAVSSSGNLSAGEIAIAATPGGYLRLSAPGSVLSLEIDRDRLSDNREPIRPIDLPSLLSGEVALSGTVVGDRLRIEAAGDVAIDGVQLDTTDSAIVRAGNRAIVRDATDRPTQIVTGGDLVVWGDREVDILALGSAEPAFVSGGNLWLVSDGIISGDANFQNGGSFLVADTTGQPGTFVSFFDPIVRSSGNVFIGDYTGASLKVEAGGTIVASNISITQADTLLAANADDPDVAILTGEPSLIFRAGLSSRSGADDPPPIVSINGTDFFLTSDATLDRFANRDIDFNTITTAGGRVILDSPDSIDGNTIATQGGAITATAGQELLILDLDTSGVTGGNVTLSAGGSELSFITIDTSGTQTGGDVSIQATNAGIDNAALGIDTRGPDRGGNVTISANGTLRLVANDGDVNTSASSGEGGSIALVSQNDAVVIDTFATGIGTPFTTTGATTSGGIAITAARGVDLADIQLDSSSSSGEGGTIAISNGFDDIILETLTANGAQGGGAISVSATSGDIRPNSATDRVALSSASGSAIGGAVSLVASGNIDIDAIDTSGQTGGGAVTVDVTGRYEGETIVTSAAAGTAGAVAIDSNFAIELEGDITATGTTGGAIELDGLGGIEARDLLASGTADGGSVALQSQGDAELGAIDVSGSATGGAVIIDSFALQLSRSVNGTGGTIASILATGATPGTITITNNALAAGITFEIGRATENGAIAALTTGADALPPGTTLTEPFDSDTLDVNIATAIDPIPVADPTEPEDEPAEEPEIPEETETPVTPEDTSPADDAAEEAETPSPPTNTDTGDDSAEETEIPAEAEPAIAADLLAETIDTNAEATLALDPLSSSSQKLSRSTSDIARARAAAALDRGDVEAAMANLDIAMTEEFISHLELESEAPSAESLEDTNVSQNASEILSEVEAATGTRPAIVYVFAREDRLETILTTPGEKPIYRSTRVPRGELLRAVDNLRSNLIVSRLRILGRHTTYGKQLYDWAIAPMLDELEAQGIDTLLFALDSGLRGLPLAALYDGDRYLVEDFAIGLMPSLNLVDLRPRDLSGLPALAMGASEFTELSQLPAVPYEVDIVGQLSGGTSFLNEEFTQDRLVKQRQQSPLDLLANPASIFGNPLSVFQGESSLPILHLATHAQFLEGSIDNSYIQLWDGKIFLNEIRDLGLHDPPLELLVLSACQTAVGNEEAELGFAGIAVKAGIKTAIASLWYVSDTGTLGLMSQFYPQLQDAPTRAMALQRAQVAMLRGEVRIENGAIVGLGEPLPLPEELAGLPDTELSHPYYWSAFTAIGSPW